MNKTQTFKIRRSDERGSADYGWLKARQSFSFADYYDPDHMGFRSLRVINQDIVAPNGGFPTHPHQNMEIFSFITSGALSHKDSMGNSATIRPGMIQLMSAGSGVTHSEFNPSDSEETRLLQIWIQPSEQDIKPSYTEWTPADLGKSESKALIISEDGRDNSATIHQDASIYKLQLSAHGSASHELKAGRGMWIQLISGSISIGDHSLHAGDAISTEDAGDILISATEDSTALLFDLN